MKRRQAARRLAVLALTTAGIASAQRGLGDWMTSGADAQRSSWVRNDAKISPESMAKPGFELVWKIRFDNKARQLNTITPPSLIDFYIGYRGFRALGFFGASDGKVIGVDTELGRVEWTNNYPAPATPSASPNCPGGITAAVTRPTGIAYPPAPLGRGAGRGSPAKSGVGAPHEGSVVLSAIASRPIPVAPPKPAKPPAGAAAEFNPFAPRVQYALALTSDGKLHSLWISNGNEVKPGVQFIPPDANAVGLISYDGAAYVATTGSCGSAGNGVWAIDLATNKVSHWQSTKEVAGTAGPAVGPDGTLYAAAGTDLVALSPKKLETVAIYKTGDAEFTSSPVVFNFRTRNLVAATTKDGRLHVVDAAQMNGQTPLARSEPFSAPYQAGALASWQDPAGTRWILVPTDKALVAWKLEEENGKFRLQRGWTSTAMTSPLPPIVVNGVVFAVSSGEFRPADPKVPAAERVKRSSPAVLYALDGISGKELWSSGKTITSFVHSGGLAAGGTRVYVATYEGTQYAFGFPIEH